MKEAERLHEMGAGGFCICPKCETRLPHSDGVRCQDERCPKCGAKLLREGSEHWVLWQKKKNNTGDQ
jgi:predicted amidophosphoribosyltransferase